MSEDQGIYVITFFSIGNAIGLAMTGWVSHRIGQVRLILTSILLFLLFSWACGLSRSLLVLVCSRFVQGLVSGPMIPLGQVLLIREGSPEVRSRDLTLWTTVVLTGPFLGPVVGGYIAYWYEWPWIFFINIPIGIGSFFILRSLLKGRESLIEKKPGDFLGIALFVLSITFLQIFLDKGQEWDWWNSRAIQVCFVCASVGFLCFIIRELTAKHPFFPLHFMKHFSFSFALILLFTTFGCYFGSVVILPLWLQQYMGYDAIRAGIAVCPLGIAPIFLSQFAPKIIEKYGMFFTSSLSFACFGLAAFYSAYFTTAVSIQYIGFSRFLFGFGFVFYLNSLIQISIKNIEQQDLANAIGTFHFFRALSAAIGASVFTTLWQRRTIFHHERVGSYITSNIKIPTLSNMQSKAALNNALDQQASLLAINDAFYVMGWLFVLAVIGTLMVRFCIQRKAARVTRHSG